MTSRLKMWQFLVPMSRLPQITNPYRRAYPSDLSDAQWEVI